MFTVATKMETTSDDSSNSDDEWIENCDSSELRSILCLFCSETFVTPELMFAHCSSEHHFNINSCLKRYASDALSFIMLVNFIRHEKPLPSELSEVLSTMSWRSDVYMKPVIDDDALLTFDIETYAEVDNEHPTEETEKDKVILSQYEYSTLQEKVRLYQLQLQQYQTDMEKMRQTVQNLLFSQEPNEKLQNTEDMEYFSSYSHYGIHQEMLQDKTRTEAYKTAIIGNSNVFENKTVLDVGCGTAILSMFCASAGAKKVISIDQSDIIYQAMQIVRENNLEKIIDLQKGRIEDITLPVDKVDVIVSEWMGYFLLYEDMIDSVIYARNRYLHPGGLIFPNRCTLSLIAVSDTAIQKKYIDFWDNVYGYRMTCMKHDVIEEAMVELISAKKICSKSALIKEFDLLRCSSQDTEFSSHFQLEILKDGLVTAIAGFFDCYFDDQLTTLVKLSTSPLSEATHWKQTVFLISPPIAAKEGDVLQGRIVCNRNRRERRCLLITITIGDNSQKYFLK